MSNFNPEEEKVLSLLVDAWNAFVKLPVMHPDDNDEFRHSIHNMQRIIGIRAIRMSDDNWYNELEGGFRDKPTEGNK